MKLTAIGLLPNFQREEYDLSRKLSSHRVDAQVDFDLELNKFREGIAKVLARNHTSLTNPAQVKDIINGLFLVDSARSAFFLALQALDLPKGSEVILPAFTCVVIANPVLWAGLEPIYVDIDLKDFNPSISQYLEKITPRTKLILVQHTFGSVVDVEKLRSELLKLGRSDIMIVEDLAHAFGGGYLDGTGALGTKADFAILTFGVEKVISTIRGGGIICTCSQQSTTFEVISC